MGEIAHRRLANSANEVALFFAAGIPTIGTGMLLSALRFTPNVPPFSPLIVWFVVVLIVTLALVGVHSVISISLIASLLHPFAGDPTLLAAAIAWAWAVSAPLGPLSRNTIYLSQRYRIRASTFVRQNLPYGAIGLVLAAGGLVAVAAAG